MRPAIDAGGLSSANSSAAPFTMLFQQDLPAHWKLEPDRAAKALAGLPLGLTADHIEIAPCLVAPDCASSAAYLDWRHSQSKPDNSVPVCLWDPSTFETTFGPKANERFHLSMRLCGRPHHLHATVVSTVRGNQQFHRLLQVSSPHWHCQ